MAKTNKTRLADEQEARSAELYGTTLTVRSGAGKWQDQKGDSTDDYIVVENKYTHAASRKFGGRELCKITYEARAQAKEPVLEIELKGLETGVPNTWVCITQEFFTVLYKEWKDNNE